MKISVLILTLLVALPSFAEVMTFGDGSDVGLKTPILAETDQGSEIDSEDYQTRGGEIMYIGDLEVNVEDFNTCAAYRSFQNLDGSPVQSAFFCAELHRIN